MGLIRAAKDAIGSLMADQWREYFYCDALSNDILVARGRKRVSGRGSNKGSDNVISNGSIVAVNEGQCMIIVEQGAIVEFCAQPGEFVYDSSTEPSLFYGDLGQNIKETFKTLGKRFTFGGSAGKDQRVYFFNIKEIMDNLYGTATPIPFRYIDDNIGLDMDVSIRCNGSYSFRIADPLLFYQNVCGNVAESYSRSQIQGQMKAELLTAMQPALARISRLRVRVSDIPGHVTELVEAVNGELSEKWEKLRGIVVVSMTMNPPSMPEETAKKISELQTSAVLRNPNMAASHFGGSSGGGYEGGGIQYGGGAHGSLCRHEYGQYGRGHECPEPLRHGSSPGAGECSGFSESTGGCAGVDMPVRTCRQQGKILYGVREPQTCRGRVDLRLRRGEPGEFLHQLRYQEA